MDRRVILAAGHGGGDNGAVARGRKEAAECVDIVNRTATKLRTDGRIETVIVPHALDLREQIAWLNARFPRHESGYALEVHKNAAGSSATGVEAWYLTGSTEAGNKAKTVLAELARVSRLQNRGIKKDVDYRGGSLAWVRQTKPWAGLFECGFITRDHFNNDMYAEGLFRGLLKLFGLRDQVAQIYRVVRHSGVQIGAFRVRSNAWTAYLSVMGDAVIVNREGTDVTAEFVDEFGPAQPIAGMVVPDAAPVPGAAELGEVIDLDHGSVLSEEPPPLEDEDEEPEPYEDGLAPTPRDLEENPTGATCTCGHELVDDVVCDVEEHSCQEGAADVLTALASVDVETMLAPDEERQLDQFLDHLPEDGGVDDKARAPGLGAPGGGWGGSQAPIQRAMRVAVRNGLKITSNKRSSGSATSDHHVSQRRSFAADMSNGNSRRPRWTAPPVSLRPCSATPTGAAACSTCSQAHTACSCYGVRGWAATTSTTFTAAYGCADSAMPGISYVHVFNTLRGAYLPSFDATIRSRPT